MNKNLGEERHIERRSEWRALVYLCKLGLTNEVLSPSGAVDFQAINWENIINLAGRHRAIPVLSKAVNALKTDLEIPDEIVKKLRKHHHQIGHENLRNARELIQLVTALREKGVEIIPYKGVTLAQEAYNDIGLREMSDIDFLINLKDFPVIRETLLSRKYVPSKNVPEEFEEAFFRQNFEYNFDLYVGNHRQFHVEPHWKIGFRRWQTDLGLKDIIGLTAKRSFFGTEIRMLTPEGFLLTTCLHHGGEDRWNSLKYICDVAAILFRFEKNMNWELLLASSDRLKVTNIVLLGIGAAVSIFNAPVTDEVKHLISSKKITSHVLKVNHQLEFGRWSSNINTYFKDIGFHFSLRKSTITKLKVLYYHFIQIFTPTVYDVNDEKSEGKKYWWLFVTKPFRIWRMHVKSR